MIRLSGGDVLFFAGPLTTGIQPVGFQSICKVSEKKMTKADLVSRISDKTGIERQDVQSNSRGVYGIGTRFLGEWTQCLSPWIRKFCRQKTRQGKRGRDILKNKTIEIPAHNIPSFKPAKSFMENVKTKVAAK